VKVNKKIKDDGYTPLMVKKVSREVIFTAKISDGRIWPSSSLFCGFSADGVK
jgi:hypothetical protein